MSILAEHSLKTLPLMAGQAQEQPSEESIFVLSSSQLQEIISRAIQPLKDEVAQLRATSICLQDKVSALEATQDTLGENDLNQLRLINDLRKKDPGKTETSRAEKIQKYLEARPDHRATFETLKGHLGIDNDRLGKAIRILVASGRCAIIKTTGDKRKRSLILLPK